MFRWLRGPDLHASPGDKVIRREDQTVAPVQNYIQGIRFLVCGRAAE